MKKIAVIMLAAAFLAPVAANAEISKKDAKAIKKEAKAKLKEYKKEKWKVFASSRTLDVCVERHYTNLLELGENGYEVVGVATNIKSKNIGKQMALNNACIQYAQQLGSDVKGRIVSDMGGDQSSWGGSPEEMDQFYSAFERSVEQKIGNVMRESFSVIRDLGNGTFEINSHFIVNEDAAAKARKEALEEALAASDLAQRNAEKISQFVNAGFAQ